MDEPDRLRVKALFARAADLPREKRGSFLDAACHGEPDVRARVDRLLEFDAGFEIDKNEETFLKSPLVRAPERGASESASSPRSAEAGLPSHIGRYRILRRQGEGGMGTVYEAEQANPRRTVALKVLRPGLLLPELLSRFSHEAQILGRLQHAGIAQVYEAGMGEDGRPFFAMEFIRGMPLDEYARRHRLDTAARLELLALVCDAVQHAHDNGVIHRDLKPGNILVDETGQPKVLDFGVAHTSAANLLATSSRTQTGQLLGTLSYMSPEQIAAAPSGLDGRSDVYTLGVILFELLAHRLPYHLDDLPVHEVARVIQQEEPSRLGSVDGVYRGDVEIIAAKALEKDKTRRYASARDLGSDIRRFLGGEPILARPASALYQLGKFARRHKGLMVGASGIMAALLAGTIVSVVFAWRAAQNARVAEQNAHVADENARVANERAREATYQSYRARIAAAVGALSRHDVTDAAAQLDAAPEALRGWEWRHLHTRLDDSTAVLPPKPGENQYLIRDPNGIRIVALTHTSLRLTDVDGHELLTRRFGPNTILRNLSPLPSRRGMWLLGNDRESAARNPAISESPDHSTDILNLLDDEGRIQKQLKGPPESEAYLAAVSPDGSRMAVIWFRQNAWAVRLYDLETDKPVVTNAQDIGFTWALSFSPDGTRVATGGEDGLTRLWDTATGAMTAQCRGHTRKVLSVAFRPDGRRVVTTSADGSVRQWDSATGREVESPYERHTGEVVTATYSPDGLCLASGGTDRSVRVWGAADLHDVAVLHGHIGIVGDLAFGADGRRLASASLATRLSYAEDGTVRIWDIGGQAGTSVLVGHTSYIYPVAFSPDGRWIASGSWDNTVRIWDARTGETCTVPLRHPDAVETLAFGPNSEWLVTGCAAGESLHIWDVATSRLLHKFKGPGRIATQAIAVSPDGTRIATGDADGAATVIDAATGAEVRSFRMGRVAAKRALAFSPDGQLLAGTGEDSTHVDVRDAQTLRPTARLKGHTGFVYSAAFSRDGLFLASASSDRTVRVWEVAAERCVAVLGGHTDEVFTAAFHPDGKRLASAGRDRAIRLWDLATGQEVARLEGHTNYVFSLAFSPDGTSLASGSGDGTVRIWETAPPSLRHQARREAEALRPEAERLVARLVAESREPDQVFTRLRTEESLSEPMRHAAMRAVMRRGQRANP
jgi:WD40 repeat protein/predicted Ser/Thr protein kinase